MHDILTPTTSYVLFCQRKLHFLFLDKAWLFVSVNLTQYTSSYLCRGSTNDSSRRWILSPWPNLPLGLEDGNHSNPLLTGALNGDVAPFVSETSREYGLLFLAPYIHSWRFNIEMKWLCGRNEQVLWRLHLTLDMGFTVSELWRDDSNVYTSWVSASWYNGWWIRHRIGGGVW